MTVATIIRKKGAQVSTIPPHRTLSEVATLLTEKKIGAVVVTGTEGSILGILSERDLVRAIAQQGATALDAPASQFMTRKVVTCALEDRIDHVMEEMTRGRFRHMPVESEGRLMGIISIGDVVKVRLAETEAETRSLRDYIQLGT